MPRFAYPLFASIFLLLAVSASAESGRSMSAEEAFRLFAKCDASFFHALKDNPKLFGSAAVVQNRGDAATLAVSNPLSESGQDQLFKMPVEVGGLRLIGWHDAVAYDSTDGGFLFWGFKAQGDQKSVATKINALLPDAGKLVDAASGWARSEIRMIGDPTNAWRPSSATSGTVTPKGSVERVLLLDQDTADQTSVYCSLQGSVTPPLLQALRPDLSRAEYPL